MHSKVLFVRAEGTELAGLTLRFVYVGSANLSESAW